MEKVEAWRKASPENELLFKKLFFVQQASADLHIIDSIDIDEALIRLKSTVNKKEKKNQTRLLFVKLAAAILLIPTLVLIGYYIPRPTTQVIPHLVEVSTNPGVISTFILPDSTQVCLNAGSKLTYPSDFGPEKRWVNLTGEGYFNVKKRENPFFVNIGLTYSIKVLGTQFNVCAYADDDFIKTTLVNGRVQLNYQSANDIEKVSFLKENEASFYSKVYKGMKIKNADIDADIAWKYGRIVFDNQPLKQVIKTLSRFYNVTFIVQNKNIYKSAITGKFNNEQLPQVLSYIKEATGIKYKINKPVVTPDGISKVEIVLTK
ncbi:MAG: DUF4974 domain-containing protein [Massilibacteroides sp.]|nr:DUF4974 domain-containing protein [Massilibacteroides sp.]